MQEDGLQARMRGSPGLMLEPMAFPSMRPRASAVEEAWSPPKQSVLTSV